MAEIPVAQSIIEVTVVGNEIVLTQTNPSIELGCDFTIDDVEEYPRYILNIVGTAAIDEDTITINSTKIVVTNTKTLESQEFLGTTGVELNVKWRPPVTSSPTTYEAYFYAAYTEGETAKEGKSNTVSFIVG